MSIMASPYAISTPDNMLLAALPAAEWEQARQSFKAVFMPLGDVLYEATSIVNHLYFPTTAVLSVSYLIADGRADGLTLIGREGFASVGVFLGADSAPCRALVLVEGWGYRIKRELLGQASARGGSMRSVLLRYVQSYITQVAQTTVCNQHHTINQQLCRWLLMFLDRQASNELPLTHEQIAQLMGVRRESVSEAAGELEIAGCIRRRRSRISVVDRSGLEARSCECYRIAKRETDRLLEISQSAKMVAARAPVDRFRGGRSDPIVAHALRNVS
jgi:CRP-like cAMP-binding protein